MSNDNAYNIASDELRQFVERIERLNGEKKDVSDQVKEVKAEAKGRGYDVKALNAVIKRRAKGRDAIAEEDAVLDLYESALGVA